MKKPKFKLFLTIVTTALIVGGMTNFPATGEITNPKPGEKNSPQILERGENANPKPEKKNIERRSIIKYNFPKGRKQNQRTEGSGSRGCSVQTDAKLNLLVPSDHVALTTESHPTIPIYLSEVPKVPIRLSLVELGIPTPVFKQEFQVSEQGIIAFKLPSEFPGLKPGKLYRLSVGLVCEQDKPYKDVFVQVLLEAVVSPELQLSLGKVSSHRQRAQMFAEASIWYDSLTEAVNASFEEQKNLELITALLDQVGLTPFLQKGLTSVTFMDGELRMRKLANFS